jgi:thioredoxin 1
MLPVTDKDFHQEIEKYKGISIVDFWAEWCAPCKVFLPIVRDVSETIEARVKVMSMNIDESPEIPAKLGIRSIPTLMMFRDGKLIETKIGTMQKTALIEWIEKNVEEYEASII